MQSNVFATESIRNTPKKIAFWAKLAVLFGLIAYIGYTLRGQSDSWPQVWQQLRTTDWRGGWLLTLALLTPVNWGFEALKWQVLARRVEPVSWADAYRGVLAGLSLGFALPAQLGDTAGRVLSLRTGRRGAAIGASLVSGGMQFYIAIVFGALAWAVHLALVPARNTVAGQGLLVLLAALSLLGVLLNAVRPQLVRWSARWPWLHRFSAYWAIIGQYSHGDMAGAFLAGAMRYVVFSLQFYCALQLYHVTLSANALTSGIGLVFLAKTITPAFNLLSDLGVREAASLWVFSPFGVPAPLLLTATLTLWLVNVLLPVAVGLIWVWRLRLTVAK